MTLQECHIGAIVHNRANMCGMIISPPGTWTRGKDIISESGTYVYVRYPKGNHEISLECISRITYEATAAVFPLSESLRFMRRIREIENEQQMRFVLVTE